VSILLALLPRDSDQLNTEEASAWQARMLAAPVCNRPPTFFV